MLLRIAIIKNKDKTNGTENLRSKQGQLVSLSDKPSGRTDGGRYSGKYRENDGKGLRKRGSTTEPKAITDGSEILLRGKHREDSSNGKDTSSIKESEQGGTRRNVEHIVQRVETVGVPKDRVGLIPNESSAFSLERVVPAAMVEAMSLMTRIVPMDS